MTIEPIDAWRSIPPLDRLGSLRDDGFGAPPSDVPWEPGISVCLRGTEVIFILDAPDGPVEAKFRFVRGAGLWQLMRPYGARWLAVGPPNAEAGHLLAGLVDLVDGVRRRDG